MKYPAWLTITLATGLSLSVIAPAIAQQTDTPYKTESTSSSDSQAIKGTIKSIIGQLVIIELANGGSSTLTLSKEDIGTYNLRPGMYLVTTERGGMTVVESASYSAIANSESSTASRILSIKIPEVSRESSSSTTTTYTESTPPVDNTVTTTTPVETTPAPEYLPPTPRALW